jgi:hypothetical protein
MMTLPRLSTHVQRSGGVLQSGGRDSNPRPRAWEAGPGFLNVGTGSWHYPSPSVETAPAASQTLPALRSECRSTSACRLRRCLGPCQWGGFPSARLSKLGPGLLNVRTGSWPEERPPSRALPKPGERPQDLRFVPDGCELAQRLEGAVGLREGLAYSYRSKSSITQMSPPWGRKRSKSTKRPSGDQTG